MQHESLSTEQQHMERRFSLPYNWCSGSYTRNIRQKTGAWKIASSLVGTLQGKTVLDAGCGDGWYTAKMVSAGAIAHGIDYSPRGIKHAEAIVEGADFKVASILDLPYPDETFDVVFSFQVIEHLPVADVPTAIKELARVTKRGGSMIVSVPSTLRTMSKAHYQHFTPDMLRDLFAPVSSNMQIVGQDRRTPFLWLLERVIQNRLWTLERFGSWFNRGPYLRRYNRTSAQQGNNLIISARRA